MLVHLLGVGTLPVLPALEMRMRAPAREPWTNPPRRRPAAPPLGRCRARQVQHEEDMLLEVGEPVAARGAHLLEQVPGQSEHGLRIRHAAVVAAVGLQGHEGVEHGAARRRQVGPDVDDFVGAAIDSELDALGGTARRRYTRNTQSGGCGNAKAKGGMRGLADSGCPDLEVVSPRHQEQLDLGMVVGGSAHCGGERPSSGPNFERSWDDLCLR